MGGENMHKDEAARGFLLLSDPNRVKICKILYNQGDLSFDEIAVKMDLTEADLKKELKMLVDGGLVAICDKYTIRRGYIDSLLDFIKTPCGCCK